MNYFKKQGNCNLIGYMKGELMDEAGLLYLFENLSETAKQKALKQLDEPLMEVGEEIWDTKGLREDIENVWFYKDGTMA